MIATEDGRFVGTISVDWTLKESRVVFEDRTWVEARTYQFPNGETGVIHVRAINPAVCILARTEDGRFLVVEQFRPGPNRVLSELPGGFIETGEDPAHAAARELAEETGYAGELELITECFDDAYSTMVRYCFIAVNCRKIGEQQLDPGEFITVRTIDRDELLRIVRSGQMTDVEVAMLGLDKLGLLCG